MKSPLMPFHVSLVCLALLTGSAVWGQSSTRSPAVPRGSTIRQGVPTQPPRVYTQPGNRTYAVPRSTAQGSSTRPPGSGTRSQTLAQPRRQAQAAPPKTFEQKLWEFIVRGKYRNWAPVPLQSDAMYEGQSPHGAFLKMYLNRRAAGNPRDLPDKSIVIKENYGPDQRTLMAVTVMFRSKDYHPQAGDWFWVKYLPNGEVEQKETPRGMAKLSGRVAGCIECHSGAEGGDYVFFNDGL